MSDKLTKDDVINAMKEMTENQTPTVTAKTKVKSGNQAPKPTKNAEKKSPAKTKVKAAKAPKEPKPVHVPAKDQKFFADITNERNNKTVKNGRSVIMTVSTTSGLKATVMVSEGNKLSIMTEGDWEVSTSKV